MTLRIEYRNVAPAAVEALSGLNAYSDATGIPPLLRRLLEIRVSQINGCRYCIEVHRRQALSAGETAERIALLEDWRGSDRFTAAERAALAWAESVTRIAETQAPDSDYRELRAHFEEKEAVDITFIVLAMNAWNRLAISFRREPPSARPGNGG
ncbi:MAG: carboxymuconolactone decarboxylase family protein [Rhodovibrionaceae bacterium]